MSQELEKVSQALQKIKPTEERIQNWQQTLLDTFKWETQNLNEVMRVDVTEYLIANPTSEHFTLLKPLDDKIKEFKNLATLKSTERKEVTKNINGMLDRLMLPEKSYLELSNILSPVYVSIKKLQDDQLRKEEARRSELNNFRMQMQTHFNTCQGNWDKYIQTEITSKYAEALKVVDEFTVTLSEFKDKIVEENPVTDFSFPQPTFDRTDVQKLEIFQDVFRHWSNEKLCTKFMTLLNETFKDFQIAQTQPEAALEIRKAEEVVEVAAIEDVVETENMMAAIEEKAAPVALIPTEAVKELKRVWSIQIEDTMVGMSTIHRAFFANRNELMPLTRKKTFLGIDANDMIKMMCEYKTKDENFCPQGIVFTSQMVR